MAVLIFLNYLLNGVLIVFLNEKHDWTKTNTYQIYYNHNIIIFFYIWECVEDNCQLNNGYKFYFFDGYLENWKKKQRKRVSTLSGHDVLYFIKYCNKLHWWLRKNDLLVTNMAFVYPFPILKIAFGKIKVWFLVLLYCWN